MIKRLREKFVLIIMSLVCTMLVIIFVLVYQSTRMDLEGKSERMVQEAAQTLLQPGTQVSTDMQLPYFTISINRVGYVTITGSSILLDQTDQKYLQELVAIVEGLPEDSGVIEDAGLRYYRTQGPGIGIAFVDISSHQETLKVLVQSSVVVGVFGFVLFLLASIGLAHWAVRPVEKAWQQQRQFVSDASHELKTPLTVIMSNAELMRDVPEEAARCSQNILTVSYQMRNLVEGLLELARADNGQVKKAFAPVDFSMLVQEAILLFEPVLYEQGKQMESQIQSDLWVCGSSQHLQQVIHVLLDNAGKYSAPGTVTVGVERQGRNCVLWVRNPGEPIPEDQLERIFHRFYRGDEARTVRGSFGLGLAIAKSVVEAHGGRIWVCPEPDGNCFRVLLPLKA